jgi:hypothetical protein
MQRMQYTPEQRDDALELLAAVGKAEAARRTGIPAGTIASWGARSGVHAPPPEAMAQQAAARVASVADRKSRLAEDLAKAAERMLRDAFAPTLERKVVPGNQWRDTEIVDVENPTTTHAERRTAIEAVARAIETVQLLTGEATSRIEQMQTAKQAAIEEAKERVARLRAVS